MRIPDNAISNADDLGFNANTNAAILTCFEKGYINSTSLMTNMTGFEEAVELIHSKPAIRNVGVHVNFAEGKPLTNIRGNFFDADGNWDVRKINKVTNILNTAEKADFLEEINAQITRALAQKITVSHLDSHLHLHTLPCFLNLFLTAAKQHQLKLRLAQTYNKGNLLKFYYRKYINDLIRKNDLNYSDRFSTVDRYVAAYSRPGQQLVIELMFHPWFNKAGELTDNYDPPAFKKWIDYLSK
ncbi:MAG TPA: ChbG/HpnK family deacetylase [Mucilaginibacter sp.]|nr:ChbG/HpnK family deacetylase [Mucilaginibacter sp.]